MTVRWSEVETFLASRGLSLAEMNPGSRQYGLTFEDAGQLLEKLSGSSFAVLGGDVVSERDGRLCYTYENWYCNREPDEDAFEYARRSHEVAREAIDNIKARGALNRYIVFTL